MYYLIYGLLYLLSLLPWPVLYFIGDCACWILYDVMGYRKNVVMNNLKIAFPEKTDQELKTIARKFYHNFVDTFIEAIKIISVSKQEIARRFVSDFSVMDELIQQGKNIQIHAMHNFNWEIANWELSMRLRIPLLVVYMPIQNKAINKIFMDLRSQFGAILLPATDFRSKFRPYINKRYALGLVADQSPGDPGLAYWLPFFGVLTPFVTGPEKGARLNNTAVVFLNFYKLKRGYYKIDCTLVTTDPRSLPEGELTRRFVHYLEEKIRERPDNYLWSHRRWKMQYKEEYAARRIDKVT